MDLFDEENLYHQFETYLVDLARNVIKEKKHCLFVPKKICGEKIINIRDVCLEEVDLENIDSPIKIIFNSFDIGFTETGLLTGDSPSACSEQIMSRLPTPALSAIRECRVLIRALMLRRR